MESFCLKDIYTYIVKIKIFDKTLSWLAETDNKKHTNNFVGNIEELNIIRERYIYKYT